jgi:hydroxylaminobenzene mutase
LKAPHTSLDFPKRKIEMSDGKRRLCWHGMFLFLLGLLTGLVEQKFGNPRMGLAAHLEGVMNGIFLIALSAIWLELRLSPRQQMATWWTLLYGTYANWAVTTLAAILGTAAMSPITGAGHSAVPWQESFVTLGFVSVGVAIIAATLLCLWGLRRTATN